MTTFPTEWFPIITGLVKDDFGQIVVRREFELGLEWTTPLDDRQPVDSLLLQGLQLLSRN